MVWTLPVAAAPAWCPPWPLATGRREIIFQFVLVTSARRRVARLLPPREEREVKYEDLGDSAAPGSGRAKVGTVLCSHTTRGAETRRQEQETRRN